MSWNLERKGTDPKLELLTFTSTGHPRETYIRFWVKGTHQVLTVDMEDFLDTAMYILTNTDLVDNDPRLPFIEKVKELCQIDGYMTSAKRLGLARKPTPPSPARENWPTLKISGSSGNDNTE